MDDQAAKLAALLLMMRSGGAATQPGMNPAALAGALRGVGPQIENRPNFQNGINPQPVPNPNPSMIPPPMIGTRG